MYGSGIQWQALAGEALAGEGLGLMVGRWGEINIPWHAASHGHSCLNKICMVENDDDGVDGLTRLTCLAGDRVQSLEVIVVEMSVGAGTKNFK